MVELGVKVEDRITGFTGIVTGRVEYITGCNQVLVQPVINERGDFVESRWFDEQRVRDLGELPVVLDNGSTPGPDTPAPRR